MGKKLILETDLPSDYCIIGIAYHHNDYLLSFHLNKLLNIYLKKNIDFIYSGIKGTDVQQFPLASYTDLENHQNFFLISNHGNKGFLIPSIKQIDYFVFVQGIENLDKNNFPKGTESVLQLIRSIPNIVAALEIKLTLVKDIAVLLSELELHMLEVKKSKK